MPDRMLRDYTTSEKFDGFNGTPETLFTRLLMKVDDYGRFDGDPVNVRGACYPRAENLRANTVDAWLKELSDHRLILCYQVSGKRFLAIINFRQRLRVPPPKPKFPPMDGKPLGWMPDDGDWRQSAATCGEPQPYSYAKTYASAEVGDDSYLTSKLCLGGLQRGAALALESDWWWDNCKVPRQFTQASLMTVLKPYVGRVAVADIAPAWKAAVKKTHQAVVDGLSNAMAGPQGYCVSCWREALNERCVNGEKIIK